MKKIAAILLLLLTLAWSAFLYGKLRDADATGRADYSYQPDVRLPPLVTQLETLNASMRRQIELLEHEQKRRAETPASSPSTAKPLHDPFAG